jgi:hypothetical protein
MKIQITPIPTGAGTNDINVTVNADDKESIAAVKLECEGHSIDDPRNPAEVSYDRTFISVTGFTPGNQHTARVTATDSGANQQSASRTWRD